MSLPVQNTPVYSIDIPSTKEKFKFRPFLVKEEKALLIAQQSDSIDTMADTLKEVIQSCAKSKIDVEKLATFDLEYIFCQIRAKSVGETVDLILRCDDCTDDKAAVKMTIDVTTINVEFDEAHNKKIALFDEVGVVMKYPGINVLDKLASLNEDNADDVISIIIECIDFIYSGDEIFHAKETKKEELAEFIDNLTPEQFKKIQEFFYTMPKFQHRVQYKCPLCSKDHNKIITGITSFF